MAPGCVDEKQLESLSRGVLPPDLEAALRTHAQGCPSCQQRLAAAAPGPDTAATRPVPDANFKAALAAMAEAPAEPPLPRGTAVGRFLLLEPLGQDGMGMVYAAFDSELDRKIALKFLRAASSGSAGSGDAGSRLVREAQAMARLSHPNVVPIYDVGTFRDQVFFAMEYVEGTTLKDWRRASPGRPWREVLRVYLEAGRGLAAAHQGGIVHRDFKPANVLIGKDGRVRVTDFGLARAAGAPEEPVSTGGGAATGHTSGSLSSPLTQSGMVMGTPGYASPEQVFSLPIDPRTDQFSFCVALWQALYGERPFAGKNFTTYAAALKAHQLPAQPRDSHVPPWVRRRLAQGLAARPEDRFESMEALLAALEKDPSAARKRAALLAAGALVVALGVGVWVRSNGQRARVCEAWGDRLTAVWNPKLKRQVRAAFDASGLPYARSAWETVDRELDARGQAWLSLQTRSCRATLVDRLQSDEVYFLQTRCLDKRLEELKVTSELLAKADVATVKKAVAAVAGMDSLRACEDLRALRGEPKLPDDPVARAHITDLEAAVVKTVALDRLGKYKDEQALAEQLIREGKALAYEPLEAEGQVALGRTQMRIGDFKTAEQTLMAGTWAAEGIGDDQLAARSSAMMVGTVVYQNEPARGHIWANQAKALLKRIGGNDEIESVLNNNLGVVDLSEGDYAGALEAYEKAGPAAERAFGPESPMLAFTLVNLADVQFGVGRLAEATATSARAVALVERSLGAQNPQMAIPLMNQAEYLLAAGELVSAEAAVRRGIAIAEGAMGPEGAYAGMGLITLARIERAAGAAAAASADAQHADQILTRTLGADADLTAWNRITRAELELDAARYPAAVQQLTLALAQQEKALGKQNPDLGRTLLDLGQAQLGLGNPVLAVAPLERALKLHQQTASAKYDGAAIRFALARALWDSSGDRPRALALAAASRKAYGAVAHRRAELAAVEAWIAAHP